MAESAEDYLRYLESTNAMMNMIESLKSGLIERGWSEMGAEQAAIMLLDNSLKLSQAEVQKRRRFF